MLTKLENFKIKILKQYQKMKYVHQKQQVVRFFSKTNDKKLKGLLEKHQIT